ncbi:MAG: repeat protein [Crocinitomicaceae bacterium]|jgi:hypothetical protein|nr:repeat protein [Crocinitomicaceae bacterium]
MKINITYFVLLIAGMIACTEQPEYHSEGLPEKETDTLQPPKLYPAKETQGVYDTFHVNYRKHSKHLDFGLIFFEKRTDLREDERSNELEIWITDKQSHKLKQQLTVELGTILDEPYRYADASRSYVTHFNEEKEVTDNDFGDFIVADFNFDSREDFAFKSGSGGNGGPVYTYYVKGKNGKFKRDAFLSDSLAMFPAIIDPVNKLLTKSVHANAYGNMESSYRYNPANGKWTLYKLYFSGEFPPEEFEQPYEFAKFVNPAKKNKEIISGKASETHYFTRYLGALETGSKKYHVITQFYTAQTGTEKQGHSKLIFLDQNKKTVRIYAADARNQLPIYIEKGALIFQTAKGKMPLYLRGYLPGMICIPNAEGCY